MNNSLYPNNQNIPTERDIVRQKPIETTNTIRLEKQNTQTQKHPLDPTTYQPETITQADLATHMRTEQYLSKTTIQKTQRYLHYMETHTGYPIDLRNPTETEIIRHIRYRLYYEDPPATIDACRHELLAINRYLRATGRPIVHYKLPPKPRHQHTLIPLPDTIKNFWHHPYDKRRHIRKLYQYMFFDGFYIGMRAPSEIANLRDYDIHFNHDGTATITITETKKHGSKRTLLLPKEIATDPRYKCFKNWFESWRPRIANENCDALFPTIKGNDWNTKYLGNRLSYMGKQVWPYYHPYTMRHWSCTARMIQTKILTGAWDTYSVQCWHGHETIGSTEKYIRTAQQYITHAPYDWINRALTKTKTPDGFEESTADQRPTESSVSVTGEPVEWARRHLPVFPINSLKPFSFFFSFFHKQSGIPYQQILYQSFFMPPFFVYDQDGMVSHLPPKSTPHAEHPQFFKGYDLGQMDNVYFVSQLGYRHRDYTAPWMTALNRFYNEYKNFLTILSAQILMLLPGAFLTNNNAGVAM